MKDKLLHLALFFAIFFLTLQFFLPKPDQEQSLSGVVTLKTAKTYSIPASVEIEVNNQTSTPFEFTPCEDVKIKLDSQDIFPDFCDTIVLESNEKFVIDMSDEYEKFYTPGTYYATLKAQDKELISQFQVKHRGVIAKIFLFFFYAPIYNLMAFLLEATGYSLGWAIVIVTLLIRAVILIPQHKMMLAQARMQQIQPQIQEIQEKHKGNHQILGMELMALYKKEGVNPLGSCGFLLIQMPILIVIYRVILGIQDTSNAFYLYSYLSDYDMTKIESVFYGLDLYGTGGINGIILAVTIAVLQHIQVRLSLYFRKQNTDTKKPVLEKKKGENAYSNFMPDPDMLNKMMLWGMPVMVGVFSYTFFAGIGVYWGIGTLFMIFQQIVVNKMLKKKV